jgi:hypothetical protein
MASITAAFVNDPVELWSNASEDDLQLVIGSGTTLAKRSNLTYEVGYSQLSAKIQSIHKMGGKILSITEV